MNQSKIRKTATLKSKLLLCLVFSILLAAPAWGKTSAVVPIPPMAWMLEQLSGEDVEIILLIPPGASPHSYEPTPRALAALAGADIFFTLNLPLERQILARLQAGRPELKIIDLNQGITMRYFSAGEHDFDEHEHDHGLGEHEHGHDLGESDPHTWLNPRNAQIQAANMARGLGGAEEKLRSLQDRLARLDSSMTEVLAPYQGHAFLVYHPSFGYLAERYGLKQVAVEMQGKEPTPRRLAALIAQAKAHNVKIIFTQPQFPQAAASRLAEEIHGAAISLDPLAYDYINNLETMVKNLQKGL